MNNLSKFKWRRSTFGMYAEFDVPKDCTVIIVCVRGGSHYQLHPVALVLPHQVYYKDCKEWLQVHDATEIVLIPANHQHSVELGSAQLTNGKRSK